ncbi:MAG: hypothetical protein HYW64_00910 [Candidatus Levybacteria bacterium]|nr:hypothetical protein [Candidatus Levybacteria bacterium]
MLVGIAGPTCSGKTTLLRELRQRLGAKVAILSFDEYDLYPSGSPALKEALKNGSIANWENPSLFDYERYLKDLQKLREGKSVTLLTRSRESQSEGSDRKTVQPDRYTLVEGVFAFSDPRTVVLFDRRFYVDIPVDEMIRRRLDRTPKDSADPWDSPQYIEIDMVAGTEYYVKPQRAKADVVLDGLQSPAELASRVIEEIKK